MALHAGGEQQAKVNGVRVFQDGTGEVIVTKKCCNEFQLMGSRCRVCGWRTAAEQQHPAEQAAEKAFPFHEDSPYWLSVQSKSNLKLIFNFMLLYHVRKQMSIGKHGFFAEQNRLTFQSSCVILLKVDPANDSLPLYGGVD